MARTTPGLIDLSVEILVAGQGVRKDFVFPFLDSQFAVRDMRYQDATGRIAVGLFDRKRGLFSGIRPGDRSVFVTDAREGQHLWHTLVQTVDGLRPTTPIPFKEADTAELDFLSPRSHAGKEALKMMSDAVAAAKRIRDLPHQVLAIPEGPVIATPDATVLINHELTTSATSSES